MEFGLFVLATFTHRVDPYLGNLDHITRRHGTLFQDLCINTNMTQPTKKKY